LSEKVDFGSNALVLSSHTEPS